MRLVFILVIFAVCWWHPSPVDAQTLYKGRVEEIYFSPNLKLPLELQAVAGTLDPEAIRKKLAPQILRAELKSFPAVMRGTWKGTLTIKSVQFSPEFYTALPHEANYDSSFFKVGKNMDAAFHFSTPRAGRLAMDPPEIQTYVYDPNSFYQKPIGILYLSTGNDVRGAVSNSKMADSIDHLLMNKVNVLSNDQAEQVTYTLARLIDKKTRHETKFYSEHVFSFKKLAAFQMNVKVAEVEYGLDGKWWKKMVLEGTLH